MKKPSDDGAWEELEEQILGLGQTSTRKSYYPALRRKLTDLERAEDELRSVNARLRDLIEATPDWIWEADAEWRYVYSSPQVYDLMGYTPAEVLGRTPFDFMTPAEAERVHAALLPVLREGAAVRGLLATGIHRDGSSVVFETSGAGVFDAAGERTGFRGIARDVTARVRAEEERRRLESQMRDAQKLESLGVLAGGIAHDFNNLLTAIMGNAELARFDEAIGEDTTARLDDVIRTSARASELCRQLLAYAGRGRFRVEPVDLSALVRDMAEILNVSIGKKVHLELDLASDLQPIFGDATQLRQVVLNLITNASDAIGDASGRVTLATRLEFCSTSSEFTCSRAPDCRSVHCPGPCVRLIVTDDGCGMDEETRTRLFEPFFTTKFTGRGLGMAAALGIVRGHGGTIDVRSAPGQGSRFEIVFPAAQEAARASATAPAVADTWTGSGCVLLAEDEEPVRAVAQRFLERVGFQVAIARDGQEAVDAWTSRAEPFDLVILDLTMPRLDGIEVLHRIWPTLGDCPVILTSGYTGNEVLNRVGDIQRVSFLQKPFDIDTFRRTVRSAIGVSA